MPVIALRNALACAISAMLALAYPAGCSHAGGGAEAARVDTALVLAVDVSESVDAERYRLQMEGIARALEDPAVIDAIEQALALEPGTLDASRDGLRRFGNLSSASVLVILSEALARSRETPRSGPGVLFAMGPGFAAEAVLLRW